MNVLPRACASCNLRITLTWRSKFQWSTRAAWHRQASSDSSTSGLGKTPLYDLHIRHGAKMVPFGGFSMPVQYDDLSVGDSHRWTREKASLFDVGHMVQHRLAGPGALTLLNRLTPSSISSLETHRSTLSCLLHPYTGGIVDDTIITRLGPELFYLVTNAACREKDVTYISHHIHDISGGSIDWEIMDGWGLIALQGPLSADILQPLLGDNADLKTLYFGHSRFLKMRLASDDTTPSPILISRAGYTGEDGFEISIPPELTSPVTQTLLKSAGPDRLRLAGLGSRDSLRLEAGMCLYGHDLDDTTTPVEAGLSWVIGKDRRIEGGFLGAEAILSQLRPLKAGGTGVERRRVGLIVEGVPAREGAEILSSSNATIAANPNDNDEIIGRVTSGCPSPSSSPGTNIAMGYIKSGFHKAGTVVDVLVRGKKRTATVTKMPFVKARYWKETDAGVGTAPA